MIGTDFYSYEIRKHSIKGARKDAIKKLKQLKEQYEKLINASELSHQYKLVTDDACNIDKFLLVPKEECLRLIRENSRHVAFAISQDFPKLSNKLMDIEQEDVTDEDTLEKRVNLFIIVRAVADTIYYHKRHYPPRV